MRSGYALLLAMLAASACGDVTGDSTQVWLITRSDGQVARVTIHGGAISSDGTPQWTVLNPDGSCSFPLRISGNLTGDQVSYSVNGAGCDNESAQGTGTGTANGNFGDATSASGSLSITFHYPPLDANTITGTWTAAVGDGNGTSTQTDSTPTSKVASLAATAGDNQVATIETHAPLFPVVVVTGVDAAPLAGIEVDFAVGSGGGAVAAATQTSDVHGMAKAGAWTLGPVAGVNTLVATVHQEGYRSATVTFTALALPKVTVSPSSWSLPSGGTKQFTVTVTGTTNTGVTWSASGGTIDATGLYVAPNASGAYSVVATSTYDRRAYAAVSIAVNLP